MSEALSRDLALLADLFVAGGWRQIRVEATGLSLLFSSDGETPGLGDPAVPAAPGLPRTQDPGAAIAVPGNPGLAPARPHGAATADPIDPAWHAVTAPNLGTFYRSPKPGSPPFVELGQRVAADTEICLLEVMKLFTSVKAGVAGIVRRIDATDAELVEGGQMLFHIEPE